MASGVAIPITVQVYKGQSLVRTEKYNQESIKIGKLSSSHLQLEDESVSRMHAVIEISPTQDVSVVDLGSTKGTFVNGQKVTKQKLAPGDEVRIGDVRLVVTFEAADASAEEIPADATMQSDAAALPAPEPARPAAPPPVAVPPRPIAPPPMAARAPIAAAPAAAAQKHAAHDDHGHGPVQAIPPAYGTKAFVPVVPPHIADQAEVRDGARAVEVAALFEDAVRDVKHFDDPRRMGLTSGTKGMIGFGLGALIISFGLFVHSYFVVDHEKHLLEQWEQKYAAAAGKDKDETKPRPERTNPAKDPAFFILLGLGMATLAIGVYKRSYEMVENRFTIGTDPLATFNVAPEDVPTPLFPLVRSTGVDYELLLTQKMTGEVQVGGRTAPLSELMSQARPAGDVPGAMAVSVPPDARINVQLGDNTFNVNSVARPRFYPVPFTIDWLTQSYTIAVFGVVGLFMALMFSVPPDPKSLSLDAFMNDQRLAKFLVKPEEQKPEEIPDWLKKQKQEAENSGGKRAKETEGKMGKKDSPAKNKIFAIKGPPTNTDIKLAKEAAKEAAANAGVLGILRSGQAGAMASIFGRDSALGRDAEDAMGGLVGTEVGDAYGAGGFGLVGSGRGGGGTGEGTIGLGNLGTIGRGSGAPGGGMYGSRAGQLRQHKVGSPEVVPGTAEVRGSLDKELIRRIIRRHINEVKFCYERELTRAPNLQGRVMVQFTIGATGAVLSSIVQSSTVGNPGVEQCIAQAVRRWEFPKPQGGIVIVTYPFVLKAAGE